MASKEDIKKLRDETGISMMECKEALEEADGDVEEAKEILEERSEAAAADKADRDLGSGVISSYIHSNNKAGTLIELRCETDFVAKNEEFQDLAYEIAMHVTAMNPAYITKDDVPEEEIEEFKEDFEDELEDKPEDVQEQIIEGKLKKFYAKHVLLEQPHIKDDEKTISDLVEEAVQKFGENIEIGQVERFETLDR